MKWEELDFWQSGEWQVVQDHLDDYKKQRKNLLIDRQLFNPKKEDIFRAMDMLPMDKVKVAIYGQDPYPDPKLATGLAFSLPPETTSYPPTFDNILREYCTDLHMKRNQLLKPGDLVPWVQSGVFLWNVIPTCETGKSLSHASWPEWFYLTKEITERLSNQKIVFVLLGATARKYREFISDRSKVIVASHPSPRGAYKGSLPFIGSRIFSTSNIYLRELGKETVDWRL